MPAEEVLAMKPDGVFLSNGPGDPEPVSYAVENIKKILGRKPIFGICLGQQLFGLALGGRTYKLKFGHHGGNQPIMDLSTRKVEIAAENHGFAVDMETVKDKVVMTHMNLNDKTCEGIQHKTLPAFSVQYHPEASPGPHDSRYLFDRFIDMMEKHKGLSDFTAETPRRRESLKIVLDGITGLTELLCDINSDFYFIRPVKTICFSLRLRSWPRLRKSRLSLRGRYWFEWFQ